MKLLRFLSLSFKRNKESEVELIDLLIKDINTYTLVSMKNRYEAELEKIKMSSILYSTFAILLSYAGLLFKSPSIIGAKYGIIAIGLSVFLLVIATNLIHRKVNIIVKSIKDLEYSIKISEQHWNNKETLKKKVIMTREERLKSNYIRRR